MSLAWVTRAFSGTRGHRGLSLTQLSPGTLNPCSRNPTDVSVHKQVWHTCVTCTHPIQCGHRVTVVTDAGLSPVGFCTWVVKFMAVESTDMEEGAVTH